MENVENKKFPDGMRVLAIDDDRLCLMVLEKLLQRADYDVTAVLQPELAIEMIRARKQEGNQFHLVITDVHMPGIDGFKLLELIRLEMDIPVAMLSANDDLEMMAEGVKQGACDYMVKPIRLEQVRNLWLQVVKKGINVFSNDAGQKKLQPGDTDGEKGCAKKTRKYTRKNTKDGTGTELVHSGNTSTQKRTRIQWSGALHRRFVEVVNCIGLDRAVPKKILKMMNVPGLGRENVASHLQKYRLYLQSVSLGTFKLSNPFANEAEWNRWNHINLKNGPEIYKHQPELGAQQAPQSFSGSPSSSRNLIACTNTTSAFGTRSSLLSSTESVQPMSALGNLVIDQNNRVVGQGSNLFKDAVVPGLQQDGSQFISFGSSHISMSGGTNLFHSGPSGSSIAISSDATGFNNTSKSSPSGSSGIMLADISNGSPSQVRNKDLSSYACVLRQKLLEASRGIPVDEDDDFQSIAGGGMLAATTLVPLQSPELANQHSVQILPSFAGLLDQTATEPSRFATLSVSANTGEAAVQPRFEEIGQNSGTFEGPLQGNDLSVDQLLEHYLAASCQMPNFENASQNQQTGIVVSEEATPMVGFNFQQTPPLNLGSNTNSVVMPNDYRALGSASNIIYTMPISEGASGNPPENGSAVPFQAVADELNNINAEPLLAQGEAVAGDLLDDNFFIDFPDDFLAANNASMDGDLTFDF